MRVALAPVLVAGLIGAAACGSRPPPTVAQHSAVPAAAVVVEAPAAGPALAVVPKTLDIWAPGDTHVGVPAYDLAVQASLVAQLRDSLRDAAGATSDGQTHDLDGTCEATLAFAHVVSFHCFLLETFDGFTRTVSRSYAWWVDGATLRTVSLDDLFVPGTDVDQLSPAGNAVASVSLAPTGIWIYADPVDVGDTSEMYHLDTWGDLGALVNPTSVLARVPHALDARNEQTDLWRQAGPSRAAAGH